MIRKLILLLIASCLTVAPVNADQEILFGTWGTEAQCARELITPKGTKIAEPFVISADWLGHGEAWCRLSWGAVSLVKDGLFTFAFALCGEDAVRDHHIKFNLEGNRLSLTWNDSYQVGPLLRCNND